ncbi:TonB-dependent receptor domain-containing protein [Rubrivirga sp. IMCC43871]|uniref:TonB-dependent receptor domain-containing protein n=1 Tax=Rubrivirga sp. IMCC43871 TaxID=3391575 RepID=UPI00398FA94F
MLRVCLTVLVAVLCSSSASGQVLVRGETVDMVTKAPMPAVSVLLVRASDSLRVGVATGADGAFSLDLPPGAYRLRASFVGYQTLERELDVGRQPLDLGPLALRPDTTRLADTVVEAVETRVEIRGDTTAFNASAYGVNADATAADLVRRLPGMTRANGAIEANGETVQRVLVDGKEFFGDDPDQALRALPADAVKEVQVYDKASDQEELTGFDDGQEETTINVVTKPERRRSLFGTARAGAGSDGRYVSDLTANRFDGDRRATLTLKSDNVDYLSAMAIRGEDGPPAFVEIGGDAISQTASASFNLNDSWGDWADVSATYQLNARDAVTDTDLARDYLFADAAGQRYTEAVDAENASLRHRLSGRAEITLSDRTELRVSPSLRFAATEADRLLNARTDLAGGTLLSRSSTASTSAGSERDASLRATLGHKFQTEGRAVSFEMRAVSGRDADDSEQVIERVFRRLDATDADSSDAFARLLEGNESDRELRGEVAFSEPLGDDYQLHIGYRPSLAVRADDQVGLREGAFGESAPDASVTSFADRRRTTHSAFAGVQRRSERLTATVGVEVEHERLAFEETGPLPYRVDQSATSLLPTARVEWTVSERSSVNLRYSASTSTPSARQLRDIVDDSNPFRLSSGNPDLRPSRTHAATVRVRTADPAAGTSLAVSAVLRLTEDAFRQAIVAAGAEPRVVRGLTLQPGAQFSAPVNLDGSLSSYVSASHGRPVAALGSNLNTRAFVSYTRTPRLLDDVRSTGETLRASATTVLATTDSERLDATVSYGFNGRAVLSDDAAPLSLAHHAGMTADWRPGSGLVLRAVVSAGYDPDRVRDPLATRLDLGLGFTFLAHDDAQLRLTVTDVLDQRQTVRRHVTDLYVEESETATLGRFALLSLSYTLRPTSARSPVASPGVTR